MFEPDPKQAREFGYYFALSQAGLEMVAPMILGAWIDYQFGCKPWATIIGVVVGFVGGTAHLIIMANQIEERRKQKKNGDS